jgi:hypothetical protein
MQAEWSDAQLGVVTSLLPATPAGVEPASGFSGWGMPVLRVSPAVTQIKRLWRFNVVSDKGSAPPKGIKRVDTIIAELRDCVQNKRII